MAPELSSSKSQGQDELYAPKFQSRKSESGPWQITDDCVDPSFSQPIIVTETDQADPVPHRRVSGYFNGTANNFTIYLPPKSIWEGRFFQITYPLQSADAPDRVIAFAADSGGYALQVSGSVGYRAEAAGAKFSKVIAREYYDAPGRKIHGYVQGGSGGSLQTVAMMENTFDVWSGAVTLIQAIPISQPYNWCIRALGGFVLANKSAEVKDAVAPGGTNTDLVLNDVQQQVLQEVAALGVPLRSWEDFSGTGQDRMNLYQTMRTLVYPTVKQHDPTYVDDFWSKTGYLGTENSELGRLFQNALVEFTANIEIVEVDDQDTITTVVLDNVPANVSTPNGLELHVGDVGSFTGKVNMATRTVSIDQGSNATVLAAIKKGMELSVDNRWYLALHSYYRHQVPPKDSGYYAWDHLRDSSGEPLYVQREKFIGPSISKSSSGGGTHTGKITGKMIVMDGLVDYDAFPWHADWYRTQVQNALGSAFEDTFQLYYSDNANHYSGPESTSDPAQIIDFEGTAQQHFRDLSAWVEKGISPPGGTSYSVKDGQVMVPSSASDRRGIQPAVSLTMGGEEKAEVAIGKTVTFKIHAEVPPGTGKVVHVEWDPIGKGEYQKQDFGKVASSVEVTIAHTYDAPGTYFPVVRVASHRSGDTETGFGLVFNLGRARVVARE
ncbi:hypothetical protein Neosp_000065 [[Neocosmospora] mangrovei]